MPLNPVLEKLRKQLGNLEDSQRFSRIVPIAEEVDRWMPQGGLPAGCIHEVKGATLASALAFSAILSARIARNQNNTNAGHIAYIARDRSLHPLGLLPYGINPNQLLVISIRRRSQDLGWAVMEALRCSQVSAVVTVFDGLDLTASRRFQLAAESSGATGFLVGHTASAPVAAPITRWKVSPDAGQPGQGFDEPAWKLDLLYCRGGRPGSWAVEWRHQQLKPLRLPPVSQPLALAG